MNTKSEQKEKKSGGFTLVELIVVIAIMVVVTTVVIYNYSKFNSTTLVTNYAYEVAFAIREAQVYGLGVIGQVGTEKQNFQLGYGLHFDSDSVAAGAAGHAFFTFFSDLPIGADSPLGDRMFNTTDPGSALCTTSSKDQCPEFVKNFNFVGNYKVDKFCVSPVSGAEKCNKGTPETITSMDITFLRPDPDAYIVGTNMNGTFDETDLLSSPNGSARIVIVSPLGNTKTVIVHSTGQIGIIRSADLTPSATPPGGGGGGSGSPIP